MAEVSDDEVTIIAIGFGSRAPPKVLEWIVTEATPSSSSSSSMEQLATVFTVDSPAIASALLRSPYRIFSTTVNDDEAFTRTGTGTGCLHKRKRGSTTTKVVHAVGGPSDERARSLALSVLGGESDVESIVTFDATTNEWRTGGASVNDARTAAVETLKAVAECRSSEVLKLCREEEGTVGDVVVVVGSGGREHALATALARSPRIRKVLVCPGNGGTSTDDNGKMENVTGDVVEVVKLHGVHTVVVGPEVPLVDGLVDRLHQECPGVHAFGPTAGAAILEASKAYSKDFMAEHGIPTASYRTFTDAEEAITYVKSLPPNERVVVKASGLAAGKGVLLPETPEETVVAVREIMAEGKFSGAGETCVIETRLEGPEASCLAFCDGTTARLMPPAQDHKRVNDGDQGPNTGGMGAYAPAPCMTPLLFRKAEELCQRTVEAMAKRGTPYVGILYAGVLLDETGHGLQVLEYNCRFGDPEAQVLLPLLETDVYEVVLACCTGRLADLDLRWKKDTCAATVVCAAQGYPGSYPKGLEVVGLPEASAVPGVTVYHAGTTMKKEDNEMTTTTTTTTTVLTSGGRVLAVTGVGRSLSNALDTAYKGVSLLSFVDTSTGEHKLHRRTDIGRRALERKIRIGVMGSTRGSSLVPVLEACRSGQCHAEVVAVLSNRSSAPILQKLNVNEEATNRDGVLVRHVSAKGLPRDRYDAECTALLEDAGVDLILLVGYMRILSPQFTERWSQGTCLNVHPSLLPKHAGGMDLEVHRAVLDAKETVTGCTVHEVTAEVDGGPVVVQKEVSVILETDTPESLKARVQAQEGPAFLEAIEAFRERHGFSVPKPTPSTTTTTTKTTTTTTTTYRDAGVDIDAGNELVRRIGPLCKATARPGCDADLGGFGGTFDLSAAGYSSESSSSNNNKENDTLLVGCTDGVGTKVLVARSAGIHSGIGIDLVAMCVNDLIVAGAEPLFFLDYYACGKLDVETATAVVSGIAEGCKQANCGLIGGETAEMPGLYSPEEYDLAGSAVGAVRRAQMPGPPVPGDVLIGLRSSGLHSNGFSLVRKLVESYPLDGPVPWKEQGDSDWDSTTTRTLGESLLTPTAIYVDRVMPLLRAGVLSGLAHITGGGLLENLPRSFDDSEAVAVVTGHPPLPPVFRWMAERAQLSQTELLKTFNCGVGMVLIVKADRVDEARAILHKDDNNNNNDVVDEFGILEKRTSNDDKRPSVVVTTNLLS